MGDYCKRANIGWISLGFQLNNHVTFNIKNDDLAGLRDNQFNESAIRDLWEHLAQFYETSSLFKSDGVTESQIKLRLFMFSLNRREKDWL